MSFFSQFAVDKYRWVALIFLALALAIIIIDNTVLNVAVPYILRDFNTSLDSLQWVISGYALIIATLLITVGRIGDIWGRKKVFLLGTILFGTGSFIASISTNVVILFLGEALIEAVGAAMMMTSSLSLLVSEFSGRERGLAFGIWGTVAGVAATIGPLLGGFLTTFYSWRWSLRINIVVVLITLLGSVFIKEARGERVQKFDWWGTFFSALGLFSLVFGFIEGGKYGWWKINEPFSVGFFHWPLKTMSIIPYVFDLAIVFLALFLLIEYLSETGGGSPLLRLGMFTSKGFSLGLLTLLITALGQFGAFFILPIYLQTVLGLNAFESGLRTLPSSVAILLIGPLVGYLSSRFGPRWLVRGGMLFLILGMYIFIQSISQFGDGWNLAPALVLFGVGIGATSSQLTNLILSSAPIDFAGEASAINSTMRQVGSSIGIAILGTLLASTLASNLTATIKNDSNINNSLKGPIISKVHQIDPVSGQKKVIDNNRALNLSLYNDINISIIDSAKSALYFALGALILGGLVSFLIPSDQAERAKPGSKEKGEVTFSTSLRD